MLGAALSALAYLVAATGYRRAHRSLTSRGALPRSGWPMLLATLAVLAIGALGAAFLLHSTFG